jgi:glycosyltransferase involved in cell wall biosynthesis
MIHATFIMEQHLGHQTLYQNLRHFIDADPQICPAWVPVTYLGGDGLWENFSFLPARIRGSLTGRQQVQRGLKVKPCDVLYFNTQVPAVLCNPQAKGKPYVIATDITPIQLDQMAAPYGHRADPNGLIQWLKHRANTRILRGAARLLPWSSWAADSLINDYGVDPERIEVIPVGVDLDWWRSHSHSPNQPARILFVGGDFVRKGGNLLLEAYRSLPKGSAELVLVTHSTVPIEDGVHVYGDIQPNSVELRSLYQACDIFVLPSSAEAFGISAVEASAMGLPVIATSSGGLSSIEADQVTGFVIPIGDVHALASRLLYLVENVDLRQQMGHAGTLRAQAMFDARKNASRLTDILVEIASGGDRR